MHYRIAVELVGDVNAKNIEWISTEFGILNLQSNMKRATFLNVTPYSVVECYRRIFKVGYGSSMFLQNVGNILPDYMTSYPRRLQYAGTPLILLAVRAITEILY